MKAKTLVLIVFLAVGFVGCGETATSSDSEQPNRSTDTATDEQTGVPREETMPPPANNNPPEHYESVAEETYANEPTTPDSTEEQLGQSPPSGSYEEDYTGHAGMVVEFYRQDLEKAEEDLWTLNESFVEGNRDVSIYTPGELESFVRDDVETLIEPPELFLETWNHRVPAAYEECHLAIFGLYETGGQAGEEMLNYSESYDDDDYTAAVDLLTEAQSQAEDANACLFG